jgi:hypothetical protein
MSRHDEDELLFEELREAVHETDLFDTHYMAAARAAFTWRTVDAELLVLAEDVTLLELGALRGPEASDSRVLEFRGTRLSIAVEITDGRVEGQILPAQRCRLTKASLDGDILEFEVDESGFFQFRVRESETFRLQLAPSGVSQVTEWVTT